MNKKNTITPLGKFTNEIIAESGLSIGPKVARKEYIEVETNVNLHITDAGDGRPVVLIHGWPLSDEMYEYQYNSLINENLRVIGITLRGFGKSDKPYSEYNYEIHASDIRKVLTILEINDAVLCGFSMGGAIALRYMSKYKGARISKLALFGAAAPVWTQRHDFPYNLTKKAVDVLIELNNSDRPKLLSEFAKIFPAAEDSLSDGIGKWLNGICISASSYATGQCLIALRDSDLRDDMRDVSVPTLIMHGKKDKICSFELAEQMKAGISNSHLIAFENSGHCLFLEETKKFNEELIDFAK